MLGHYSARLLLASFLGALVVLVIIKEGEAMSRIKRDGEKGREKDEPLVLGNSYSLW